MQPLHMSRRKQLCKGMGCWILCMHWRALYQCCVLHESRALRRIAGGRGLLLLSIYPCINMLTVISFSCCILFASHAVRNGLKPSWGGAWTLDVSLLVLLAFPICFSKV